MFPLDMLSLFTSMFIKPEALCPFRQLCSFSFLNRGLIKQLWLIKSMVIDDHSTFSSSLIPRGWGMRLNVPSLKQDGWFFEIRTQLGLCFMWASQVAQWYRIGLPMQEMQETGGSIFELGRSSGVGNGRWQVGNMFQYSCLENSMDRGAQWAPSGLSSWGHKESDTTERLNSITHVFYVSLFIVHFSVAKSCLTLWNPMDCSMSGFPVLHHLLEFAQTHIH